MKRTLFLTIAAMLLLGFVQAQQLNAAEYFFDTDPGVGNGTALTVTTGDSILFSGNISATGLTNGFHILYIRAKDVNDVWSLSERRVFNIAPVTTSATLAGAEYFFDTDPGVGNGISLTVTSGDSILFGGNIASTGLQSGFHFLYVRARDAGGIWSLAERRVIYIQPPPAFAPMLIAAEYFVNTDPGIGNATPITVTPGDSIDFSGPLAITDTAAGFDSLYIRVMDLNGVWSLYEPRGFEISNNISVNEISASDHSMLFQNYPNPFNRFTTIEFYLDKPGDVMVYFTDNLGRTVREIKREKMIQGKNSITLDKDLPEAGTYFYKLVAGDFTDTKKMTLIR